MDTNYPAQAYADIKASVPADLSARVLAIIKQHVGKDARISRRALDEEAFGCQIEEDLSKSTEDRQVRMVMAVLQDRYPILSTSGGGGYFYASSADEITRYSAELDSRAKKLLSKSRALAKMAKRFQRELQLSFPV